MNQVKVRFMHPVNGSLVDAELDLGMGPEEVIEALIDEKFLDPNPGGYQMAFKGGRAIPDWQSFKDAGVQDGSTLRVIPHTEAGFIHGAAGEINDP